MTTKITVFWDVMSCILDQTTRHHIPKRALFIVVFTETYYWAPSSASYVNPVYALTPCKTGTDILLNFCMNFSTLKRVLKFLEYKLKTCRKRQPTVHTALLPDETQLHAVRSKPALKYGGIISVQYLCIAVHRQMTPYEVTQGCV